MIFFQASYGKPFSAKHRRGAVSPQMSSGFWVKTKKYLKYFTVICVASTSLFMVYVHGGNAWKSFSDRPIENILVEGRFVNVSQKKVMDIITGEIKDDFLQIDLNDLRGILEQQPWIERVVVARRWPSALIVKFEEQIPIARWGDVGFLNQRGEVVYAEQNDSLLLLPWLFGHEAESSRIMKQYQNLSLMLRSRNLLIDKLWMDEKNSWQLKLKSGVDITLGKSEILVKIQRFIQVYDQYLAVNINAISTIDLRYVNGLAVGWINEYNVALEDATG